MTFFKDSIATEVSEQGWTLVENRLLRDDIGGFGFCVYALSFPAIDPLMRLHLGDLNRGGGGQSR